MSVETLELWKNLFEIVGVVLLLLTFVAGAGVLWFSRKLNDRQAAQLRNFDKDLTDAKTKLGEQQERAAAAETALKGVDAKTESFRLAIAKANERATKAQESLALAEQHAAEANAKAEGFRLDIARANERAASANETAEREKLARLQLEARLADRVLTADQQRRITSAFKGQSVELVVFGETPETSIFGISVADSIGKAEDVGIDIIQSNGSGMAVRGIFVGVRSNADASVKQAADLFIQILHETIGGGVVSWDFDKLIRPSGFIRSVHVGKSTKPDDAPLRIFIGSKQ
jgi:hypothetical protein